MELRATLCYNVALAAMECDALERAAAVLDDAMREICAAFVGACAAHEMSFSSSAKVVLGRVDAVSRAVRCRCDMELNHVVYDIVLLRATVLFECRLLERAEHLLTVLQKSLHSYRTTVRGVIVPMQLRCFYLLAFIALEQKQLAKCRRHINIAQTLDWNGFPPLMFLHGMVL